MHYKTVKTPGGKIKMKEGKDNDLLLFHPGMDKASLKRAVVNALRYEEGKDYDTAVENNYLMSLAWAIKHRLVDRWIETQKHYHEADVKQVFYLSLEYLTGQAMKKNLINLEIDEACRDAFEDLGLSLDEITELEPDAALGNGGLGRLAACYLDSMATLGLPAHGYGLRYEYGIFKQVIEKGYQVEMPDSWLTRTSLLWEFYRPEHTHVVEFKGVVKVKIREDGTEYVEWTDTEKVLAEAYDTAWVGYNSTNVNTLRLWSAESTQDFNLSYFNTGNYLQAVERRAISKTITRVLYPNDSIEKGLELRLCQEYFLVSATLQDIIGHFKFKNDNFDHFPDKVAIQLNDTHPALGIPELMRILIDIEHLDWDRAWNIVTRTFSYTNHTILPEALERWSVSLLERILPRHLQIIFEINSRFMRVAANEHQMDTDFLRRTSIVEENGGDKRINMAHLSILGSHKVNGVSRLHTQILKEKIFKDFDTLFPDKIVNKTNGITPRRWLKQCNPLLSELITEKIGNGWIKDLYELKKLLPYVKDASFVGRWAEIKHANKQKLAAYIRDHLKIEVDPLSMFDVQIKRIHQYKRQLLNVLHVIALYNYIKKHPKEEHVPRTVIFSGKAAPSYQIAKRIIKLINTVGDVINHDTSVNHLLKVVFIPDYKVFIAEKIIPAADLSEQISTAGYEASGTGNMKLSLNGALTIGTLDGANIEIAEEVGPENIFSFGMTHSEIEKLKSSGYDPLHFYHKNEILKEVIDLINSGFFNLEEPDLFHCITERLFSEDAYCILADFTSYFECQQRVSKLYKDQKSWTEKSILNTANMGKFSSDRAIKEYAEEIWKVEPTRVPAIQYDSDSQKHTQPPSLPN